MARRPLVVRSVPALRKITSRYRAKGETVALVPTMGALHDGHLSLVRVAHRRAKRVIVSIFVNPAQFAPSEDFKTYPRSFNTDLAMLAALKVDLIWAPTVAAMYPEGFATKIAPEGPALVGLEDRFRPHFFGGVATVVSKLFLQTTPDFAIFGEKDYQQLRVVTRMARDLDLPLRVIGVPTVREKDGLAMSSRNAYLSPDERKTAPLLHRVLKETAAAIKSGTLPNAAIGQGRGRIEQAGFKLDYLEARHA
ncbi:MAG: pantoate--beta-alanine ligase, partial [Pseudorhodoplanes sp.]|nr:pantoate--beta-alanine ligase [Pseudorhodoplanes sp.]